MLNFVAATQSEAEPLIRALRLQHRPASFPLYRSDNRSLVISGIGKVKAAAACAWLAACNDKQSRKIQTPDCWINFGIAGHPKAELGTTFIAHKITEHQSGKTFYPPQIRPPLATSDLTTVDTPLKHYLPDQLHDMEASAFIDTARMFANAELVQSVKIVSDNTDNPLSKINQATAQALISDNLNAITTIASHLLDLAKKLESHTTEILGDFHGHWRFSVSQAIMLDRLLQKHRTFYGPMTDLPSEILEIKSAGEVLNWLTKSLDDTDYST